MKRMKHYQETYQKYQNYLNRHPLLLCTVLCLNRYITRLMYIIYPLLLLYHILITQNVSQIFKISLIPATSFILLSLLRKFLNAPRPYEKDGIMPLVDKQTKGNSLPSRHVFSATIISMCALTLSSYLGGILLFLSLLLALCRVLVGVHYRRDVLVGFYLGILVGLCLFL